MKLKLISLMMIILIVGSMVVWADDEAVSALQIAQAKSIAKNQDIQDSTNYVLYIESSTNADSTDRAKYRWVPVDQAQSTSLKVDGKTFVKYSTLSGANKYSFYITPRTGNEIKERTAGSGWAGAVEVAKNPSSVVKYDDKQKYVLYIERVFASSR
jgi:hypothetical protein